jgi:hypothetical protein
MRGTIHTGIAAVRRTCRYFKGIYLQSSVKTRRGHRHDRHQEHGKHRDSRVAGLQWQFHFDEGKSRDSSSYFLPLF